MTPMLWDLPGQAEFFVKKKLCPIIKAPSSLYWGLKRVLIKLRLTSWYFQAEKTQLSSWSDEGLSVMWCQVDMSSCHHVWLWSDSIQSCDSIFSGCVLLILSAAAIWSPNNHHRGWRSLNTRTDIRWDWETTRSAETWGQPEPTKLSFYE